MGGNGSVWADLCAVLGFNSLFGFSFDIALLPVLSLDLKQPLLKHFCSDRKSETDKTLCYSKDNPIDGWSINRHRPSFNDQNASCVCMQCQIHFLSSAVSTLMPVGSS